MSSLKAKFDVRKELSIVLYKILVFANYLSLNLQKKNQSLILKNGRYSAQRSLKMSIISNALGLRLKQS